MNQTIAQARNRVQSFQSTVLRVSTFAHRVMLKRSHVGVVTFLVSSALANLIAAEATITDIQATQPVARAYAERQAINTGKLNLRKCLWAQPALLCSHSGHRRGFDEECDVSHQSWNRA